ncbi:MAG TPA: isoaspartyl peptidase/L-asparaginase [Myxococcota bacterium]|jgi:isoaspartyl peptidase/L-asparaginase-like protein (Ntn-hydrolase superfamily)|nr:isoaspartyl peptidase/L-asparaginase [Myxococcota bacterium]
MKPVIAIHGGAGVIRQADFTRHRAGLSRALEAGWAILERGGSSLDAVTAAVVVLEDDPHFNAGRGAVYDADEKHELDASIMDGATLRAGGVTVVSRIRNPILAARAVMEHSPHVLLAGRGAERFARRHGVALAPASYFHTRSRLAALRRNLAQHHGTVGAVARDRDGHLAAATSTGGFTGKLPGRVGDSPIVGAGTWADDSTCAVSGTGHGELFIRTALAHEVAARMRHRGDSLRRAAAAALEGVARLGGSGGLVAVDRRGNIAMPFHSAGMFRARIGRDGKAGIAIYR